MPRIITTPTCLYSPEEWEATPSYQYYTTSTSTTDVSFELPPQFVWWDKTVEYQAPDGSILPIKPLTNHDYVRYMQAGVPIPYPEVEELCAERRRSESEKQQQWLEWLSRAESTELAGLPASIQSIVE
jgi:hypothetical protein